MLEVQIVRNNGTIDFNFEDIKDALASELELYKNLVFTEETKTDAKKTVAELRKLKKQTPRTRTRTSVGSIKRIRARLNQ